MGIYESNKILTQSSTYWASNRSDVLKVESSEKLGSWHLSWYYVVRHTVHKGQEWISTL